MTVETRDADLWKSSWMRPYLEAGDSSRLQPDWTIIDRAKRLFWRDSADLIFEMAERAFEVPQADLRSRCRQPHVSQARWAVWWVARKATPWSWPLIAARTGGFDHASVIHGVRQAERLRGRDPRYLALTSAMLTTFVRAGRAAPAIGETDHAR
ncbi:MAG: helix-turn-helix domain-containing protein [Sphingomonadaceae bacterium]